MDEFTEQFHRDLGQLFRWRRDVRRFRTDPVPADLLQKCLDSFSLAPSVGLSEPWRIISVESDKARAAALSNFETENTKALSGHSGARAELYAGLKLSGMREAPVQLAIFCDEETSKGANLGAATMPETRRYSVVAAITQMWLLARAYGLGLGWVSILDAPKLARDLDVPESWTLVAYLCLGWPEETAETPELEQAGWERRDQAPLVEIR
ncbi:5,6-dimethylbenzimidazole synthase [Halocynthiibacter sp. C4]|uniref:5,6-dimethylbenzimidazole synthase n=1 Tax=Halocynthiibacter sp. C4 TaxID=2992758 RepID=UPI00237C46AC|nr:5,6-dimethylbenzimidazole synthase [Halocynthiibacter sp. C4]MDE0588527.1 5,6-dimethylbenzimidazole synthase [Halocynthiibacter sp. C4]